MIQDGYTIHGGFDTRRFSYRPALHAERIEFMRGFKTEETVRQFIYQHLVWDEGNFEFWSDKEIDHLFFICLGVDRPQYGSDWTRDWESRDSANLYDGVILQTLNPRIAKRSCTDCKKYWFDEDTGKIIERNGLPVLRPVGSVTLCETNEGCPKGTPENPKGLSEKNQAAFRHFQECDAVGGFPDDPIVRHNARIIRRALKHAESQRGRE